MVSFAILRHPLTTLVKAFNNTSKLTNNLHSIKVSCDTFYYVEQAEHSFVSCSKVNNVEKVRETNKFLK